MLSVCSPPADPVPTVLATPNWQSEFEELLPDIRSQARFALRHLFGEAQQEALQEVIATACLAFARLHGRGRREVATAHTLARFAAKRYRIGRRVAERTNVLDVTSTACRLRKSVRVQSLDGKSEDSTWEEVLVDTRFTPADLVATKLDFSAFLATLDLRRREIAEVLATGETTQDTARVFGLSPGRISQLRMEFKLGWDRFVGNVMSELAVA